MTCVSGLTGNEQYMEMSFKATCYVIIKTWLIIEIIICTTPSAEGLRTERPYVSLPTPWGCYSDVGVAA